jgi:SAM-dependent methyltransferase
VIELDSAVISPDELLARVRVHLHGPDAQPQRRPEGGEDARLLEENVRQLHNTWPVPGQQFISSHRAVIGPLIVLGKKVLRKLSRRYFEHRWGAQVSFNGAVTRAVSDLMRLNATSRLSTTSLLERTAALEERSHPPGAIEDARVAVLVAEVEALKNALATLSAQAAAQAHLTSALRDENIALSSGLRRLKREQAPLLASEPVPQTAQRPPEIDYVLFENRFRGSREEIKGRMAHYLTYFETCFDGQAPVLDIGCGRGEMLELLLSRRVDVLGVELNDDMAAFCQDLGLPIKKGDGLAHLAGLPDSSLGGIFVSQVIEHLNSDEWFQLLESARQKLRWDGVLILETINPGSFYALANAFYKDLTHIRPVHPDTLQFAALSLGYRKADILMLSPHPSLHLGDGTEGTQALLETVFGHQDYALIARR